MAFKKRPCSLPTLSRARTGCAGAGRSPRAHHKQVPILGTPAQVLQHRPAPMPEMPPPPPQFPKDKRVLALLGSSFSQTLGPADRIPPGHLDFQETITLGWESLDKRVYSLVAGMRESSSSRCP